MPDKDLVLWLDLETDGTPDQEVIEIGCILTDQTPAFNEIARYESVVIPSWAAYHDPRAGNPPPGMQPFVAEMHVTNGLWDDVLAVRPVETLGTHPYPWGVEVEVCDWLDAHGGTSEHIPFAGSGVGHFDGPRLAANLPKLRKRLTYYSLDIGNVRRFVHEVKGLPWLAAADEKPHRALADAEIHLDEARWFLANVRIPG